MSVSHPSAAATARPANSHRRVLLASFVGTGIEFYDFYIYATAASLVFGALFFPAAEPGMQQMASFATLAVAFFARPVGAAFFGHFGDRIGRKSTLVASLLTMGASTTLIAFLPTYADAAWVRRAGRQRGRLLAGLHQAEQAEEAERDALREDFAHLKRLEIALGQKEEAARRAALRRAEQQAEEAELRRRRG